MMDLIVSWLCSALAGAMEWVVETICKTFDYDISTFNETFDFAATAYDIILSTALPLALILAAWSIIVFFWKGADKASTTPVRTVINLIVAVGFIYFGNRIFDAILDFCQYPYNAIVNEDAVKWGVDLSKVFSVKGVLATRFAKVSSLVYLIMILIIGISLIKLLLEIVERYVVTFVLMYLSPLAAATLASSTTSGIYKKFFSMFVSQCILIFLNAWCLKMAVSGLSISSSDNDVIVCLLLVYAFLKISSRMDSYLNQLGLNSAITGGGIGAEILGAGAAMFNHGGNGGGGGGNGGGGIGSKILGAPKAVGTWTNRYDPLGAAYKAATDAAVGGVKGTSEAFRSGAVGNAKGFRSKAGAAGKGLWEGAKSGFRHSDNGISNIVENTNTRKQIANTKAGKAFDAGIDKINDAKNRIRDENTHPELNPILTKIPDAPHIAPPKAGYTHREEDNAIAMLQPTDKTLAEVSGSESRANSIFKQAQKENYFNENWTDSRSVSSVMEGLGLDKHSKEVADCIQAGYGRDGAQNIDFSLTSKGIHAQYDINGYRHKTDVVDSAQFKKLSKQEQAGFEKSNGSNYYVRSTKTQFEKPQPADTEKNN